MEVLIYKTNLTRQSQVSRLQALLSNFNNIKQVSVDLDDCDKVLRIVGVNPLPGHIELLVSSLGVSCSELEG